MIPITKIMIRFFCLFPLAALCLFSGLRAKEIKVSSPDKRIKFELFDNAGSIGYRVWYNGSPVVNFSRLSISFKEGGVFDHQLRLGAPSIDRVTEDYQLITGKASHIHSESNRLQISIKEGTGLKRELKLEVRVFNDGLGFRYLIPQQQQWQLVNVTDEANTFNFAGDPMVLTLFRENYTTSHEGIYDHLHVSEIKPDTLMDMPALFELPKGIYVGLTEASLRDYAGMYLVKHQGVIQGCLSPLPGQTEIKVKATLPHSSPWRVMMISNRVGALIESNILTNLNEPCAIKDVSWIKPGKTTFPWWNGNVTPDTSFAPGNNFETNYYYVKFCAANNIQTHSVVEYGLKEWYINNDGVGFDPGPTADPSKPVALLDMQKLCDSAKKLGVGIRVWVHWRALYPNLDKAFTQYEKWGLEGLMCDFMDRDDQEMVNIQEEILRKAAQHHLHLQFHGAYKPTGLNRTYPNEFTREGTLNYENDKWGRRVTPDADINIPFTRMLAGSTDYHLGGFRAANEKTFKVHYTAPMVFGTRCHMLAMYVVLENALGMVCDFPDAYLGQPGFDFIKLVPTVWDETHVVNAKVGEYITIARRNKGEWYVGTITNNTQRQVETPLSFLPNGNYTAEIWSDAPDAGVDPNKLVKEIKNVTPQTVIKTAMTGGGGQVIRIYRTGQ